MKTLTIDQRQRRERILSCVREQLSRTGYEGINMRELAVAAEVSTATLYNLYLGKDALILAALEDLLLELNGRADESGRGLDRMIARLGVIADQVVATPRYAEAMAKMLFAAEASDQIVRLLIGASIQAHREELAEMLQLGELSTAADIGFLARTLTVSGWGVIMAWMKGFIALHDFRQEYVRTCLNSIGGWVAPDALKAHGEFRSLRVEG